MTPSGGAAILHLRQCPRIWGPDRYIQQVVAGLPELGMRADVAILDSRDRESQRAVHPLADAVAAAGGHVAVMRADWAGLPATVAELWSMVVARGIRLVHSHEFKSQAIGSLVARLAGVPHVTTDHGELLALRRWYGVGMWCARSAALVMAGSRDRMRRLQERGIAPDRIAHCPYGIDPEAFASGVTHDRGVTRGASAASADDFVVLCPARFESQKGQDVLVEAACRLRARGRRVTIWITGTPTDAWQAGVVERAARGGVQEAVRFLGYTDRMPDLLAACDLVVLPSREENFPYAVLEAFAMARPVIATRVGGVPELVRGGANGWSVPPEDAEALAAAIEAVLDSPQEAAAMAAAGRRTVEVDFHVRETVARTAALYRTVLAEHPDLGPGADGDAC